MISMRIASHQHRFLGAALIALHLSQWWVSLAGSAPAWLALHMMLIAAWLGLGWPSHRRVHLTVWLLGFAIPLIVWPSWTWSWELMLLALLASQTSGLPVERFVRGTAIVFLVLEILLANTAQNTTPLPEAWWPATHAALLFIPSLFLLLPASPIQSTARPHAIRGLLVLFAVFSVWAGTLYLATVLHWPYLPAVGTTLTLVIGVFLAMYAFWWSRGEEDSWQQLWTPNLLNISPVLEQWLAVLTQPGDYKQSAQEEFWTTSSEKLLTLPGIIGMAWRNPYDQGEQGVRGSYETIFTIHLLEISIFSRRPLHGLRYAHIRLLLQLLEYFHQAKDREKIFAEQARLKAIHETGAKLTHDIKNLLQSLHALTSAAENVQPERLGDTLRLYQAQLPHLAQRLKRTLDTLKKPEQYDYANVPVRTWWDNLQARYRKRAITNEARIMWNSNIPEELFDNIAENLLENALIKRQREPELQIHVTLIASENQLSFSVCDNGSAIPADIYKQLLTQPVSSRNGFGIGLYQAAKQTIHTGYRLTVSHNEKGRVCFELASI